MITQTFKGGFVFTRAVLLLAITLICATGAQAANLLKTATATMNAATDWTLSGTGTAPSSSYVGEINNTPTSGNLSGMQLGGSINLLGLLLDNNMAGALTIGNTGGYTLTLGASGIDMSAANNNATLNCTLSLGAAQTWNVISGKTLKFAGTAPQISGSSLLTVAGTGGTTIGYNDLSLSAGLTKTGAGTLTITGGAANAATIGSGSTLTVNGGIVNLSNPSGANGNVLNSTANASFGGGALLYSFAQGSVNQTLANLTINPGESALFANRIGSISSAYLSLSGTVTRNAGGLICIREYDSSREQTFFLGVTPNTLLTSGGAAYLILGNNPGGAQLGNFSDWGLVASDYSLKAVTYTSTTANSLGTSAQNANVAATVTTTTLGGAATDASFRDNANQATTINLAGYTWQTGGILIGPAKATAGSVIEDTVGTGSLTGPTSSDLPIIVAANATTPEPFTISAKIADNTRAC